MGTGVSHIKERERSKTIEDVLKQQYEEDQLSIKLLLLGPGESGKSTVLKQFRILHTQGYTTEEKLAVKPIINANVIESMETILNAMKFLMIPFDDPQREIDACLLYKIMQGGTSEPITADLGNALKCLWADAGVQKCFARSSEYQLIDCAKYFLDSIDRLCRSDYIPSQDDILRARLRTTGIVESRFEFKQQVFRIFDVGGQRTERRKWIHCFDDVKSIVFVASISDYDQTLLEDGTTMRMEDSLALFGAVCENQIFSNTSIILFLNKSDIFREKITRVPLTVYFKDYSGPMEFEPASKYIHQAFLALNKMPHRPVFAHLTCATDTSQIRFVIDSVVETLVAENLKGCGLT